MSTDLVKPMVQRRKIRPRWAVAFSLAAFAMAWSLPFWMFTTDYGIGLLLQISIYAGYGLSWHLLAGYSGQYSFGHATFFGTGAYVAAILNYRFDISPWIGLFVGAAAAAVVGILVGFITLRLSGLFFGLVTFGIALMLGVLATHFIDITGGAAGLSLPLRVDEPAMMQFSTQTPLFHIGLTIVGLFLLITVVILRSRLGLAFRAVRDDEVAAEASGVRTRRVRVIALTISAAMAGLVGGLYAQSLLFIDPDSGFGMAQSVNAIFTAIIGGMGTMLGPVLGAVVLVLLQELGNIVSGGNGIYSVVFYSAVVFMFLLFVPKGLAGVAQWLMQQLRTFRKDR